MPDHRKKLPATQDDSIAVLALEGTQDGLWDWDCKSGRIYFDPRWKAIIGYGESQLSDNPQEWFSRVHHNDLRLLKKKLKMHTEGKTVLFRSEHRLLHTDGNYRWVLARGISKRTERGDVFRIVGTLTDINDLKQHELELLQQLDEFRFALASEKVLMEELDRKNRELTELSITDGLTGLYNHRHLQERFDYEFKRVRRYGGMLSCMLIDIDNFKLLNDKWGHQYGDYVLRQIASIIKTHSREVDICGRYGGEEFMIISNLHERNALLFATKLHAAVQEFIFKHPSATIRVTVSIGVAGYNNQTRTKQELIERADKAMYQAKNEGRNLIRLWKEVDASGIHFINQDNLVALQHTFKKLSGKMHEFCINSTISLIEALESENASIKLHSDNVSKIAVAIGKKMNLSDDQLETVRLGALLHDIGKLCITNKAIKRQKTSSGKAHPGSDRHPEAGAAILKEIKFLEKELPVVLYHHERFDGKGFPYGLHGREIPVEARIVGVADAFEHMTSGSKTGKNRSAAEAGELLIKATKIKFCPETINAITAIISKKKTPLPIPSSHRSIRRHQ